MFYCNLCFNTLNQYCVLCCLFGGYYFICIITVVYKHHFGAVTTLCWLLHYSRMARIYKLHARRIPVVATAVVCTHVFYEVYTGVIWCEICCVWKWTVCWLLRNVSWNNLSMFHMCQYHQFHTPTHRIVE